MKGTKFFYWIFIPLGWLVMAFMIYETATGVIPYIVHSDAFYQDSMVIELSITSREDLDNESGANYNYTIRGVFQADGDTITTRYKSIVEDGTYSYPVPMEGDTIPVWNTEKLRVTKLIPVLDATFPVGLFTKRLMIHLCFYIIFSAILIYFTKKLMN